MPNIFNLNTSTGVIGSDTGLNCSAGGITVSNSAITPTTFTIDGVTGVTGFSFGSSLSTGQSQTGFHSSFTGSISVTIGGSDLGACLSLIVNGTPIQNLNIGSSGVNNFTSHSYLSSDNILIILEGGDCT